MLSEQTMRPAPIAETSHAGAPLSADAASPLSAAPAQRSSLADAAATLNRSPRVQNLLALQTALSDRAVQRAASPDAASRANRTGLPDAVKAGVETLSGMSLDNVRVHYNSPRPAQMKAHAFAQGNDIHVAPGQQQHVPHEAWHVVQQAQGRVRPTMQLAGGVPVNDQQALEHEADVMGARAVHAAPDAAVIGPAPRFTSSAPAQRVLTIEGDEPDRTFVEVGDFLSYVDGRAGKRPSDRFWATPIMMDYLIRVASDEQEPNVSIAKLDADIEEAVIDAERLDTLDPEGPVPDHRELATFAEEADPDSYGHSKGPLGYAGKMMGRPGARDDFAPILLDGVTNVVLTTGPIESLSPDVTGVAADQWAKLDIAEPEAGGARRPGLSIINYSSAIYKAGDQLAICGVRGKILMDQFGLAIREYVHGTTGNTVAIQTIFNAEAVQPNYSRLLGFFQENPDFRNASTVVFGYASAFEDPAFGGQFTQVQRKEDHGWVGYLFQRVDDGRLFAVFDSDLTHSYHGEILAQNVKMLLENEAGANVQNVLIGGSAGSLVAPKNADGEADADGAEETLLPNGIYLPEGILRPDGYFKKNALHDVAMKGAMDLATLPGSMHTSVVSVLAETPGVLDDLFKFGIKTVDMEFAYVALVLGEQTKPEDKRDLADVKLGIACLVTDFPKTGAHGVALAEKNEQAKKATKALFVSTVIASMQ